MMLLETWFLIVNNYTEAMNGKRFLKELNIKSSVEKISGGSGGCAYAIKTKHDPDKATRLLSTVGVNVTVVRSGKYK